MSTLVYKQVGRPDAIVLRSESVITARRSRDGNENAVLTLSNGNEITVNENWKKVVDNIFGIPPEVWGGQDKI